MNRILAVLGALVLALGLSGCSLPDFSEPAMAPTPADRDAYRVDEDGVERPEGADVTAITRFMGSYNLAVPEPLRMTGFDVEHSKDTGAFFVGNGVYRLVFRLNDSGEVQSVFYQDGLSGEDQKTVSMALAGVLAGDGGLGTLKEEAEKKRLENDGYTQGLVDAIDGFGSAGVPESGTPHVSLDENELPTPELFTRDDLQAPEVEAPSPGAVPKNPNEPDLPEIGNFGKLPE